MKALAIIAILSLFVSAATARRKPVSTEIRFSYAQTNGVSGCYDMSVEGCKYYASWCVVKATFKHSVPWHEADWSTVVWLDAEEDHYYAVVVRDPSDFDNPANWYRFAQIQFHPSFYASEGNELWVDSIKVVRGNSKKLRKD